MNLQLTKYVEQSRRKKGKPTPTGVNTVRNICSLPLAAGA